MSLHKKINAKYIRSVLDYDSKTGFFTWKYREAWPKEINSRLAGKKAGSENAVGYIEIRLHDKLYLAHRLAWLVMKGEWPEFEIDHKNTKKSDNKFSNLRHATHAQNKYNCGLSKRNKSGFKGVSWNKNLEKWCSQITLDGKHYYLGLYANPKTAHRAYIKAAKKYHGKFLRAA